MLLSLAQPALGEAPARLGPDAPLRLRTGGGNLVTHEAGQHAVPILSAITRVGARLVRMSSYGWRAGDRTPTPQDLEAAMLQAYRSGIVPVLILEYEGSYQFLQPAQPIGSYADWHRAGAAYAARFRPNGDFWRQHGIRDWGVILFTAINEPDVQATIPHADYRAALAGLADGVHSIDAGLRVVPGGFATCNSHGDATLRGYGPVLRDLIETRKLDGIDLHTYYNAKWFPLTRGREFSAQSCFDRVKAAMGVTRADVSFYATEFNIARSEDWADAALTARLFLTALWDNLAVVQADGRTPAAVLAMPWNLADTGAIEGPPYAMAAPSDLRGRVLQMVLTLAGDMHSLALDPRHSGIHVLGTERQRLYVWQNLAGWTDRPGAEWRQEVPDWATSAELWGWDGLRGRLAVEAGAVVARDLPGDETYMLLVK